MKNATGHPIRWSVQSVTQYDTSDVHDPAKYNRNFWAFTPVNPPARTSPATRYGTDSRMILHSAVSDGLFKLHWAYLENEVWLDSTAGWVAVVDGDSQFAMVERFQYIKGADYPGKASVIFYKNGAAIELNESGMPALRSADVESTPYYMEAEINSPMIDLQPGENYAMDTTWWPTRAGAPVRAVTNAGVVLSPVSVTGSGNSLALSASFGVFFSGKLQARLFDLRGVEQQFVDLQPVAPQTPVDLRQEIRASKRPVRISIHLIDDQGIDRGSLGETLVPNN